MGMWFCFFTYLPKALNPLKKQKGTCRRLGTVQNKRKDMQGGALFFTPLKAIM
jgi:hypothetical protein